ncbi:MAG: DUF6378 domain-containing protein [Verrucomicrobiia bacterium]
MTGTILEEALALVRGERHETYGDASLEFHRVAAGWRVLANGQPITAEMVPLFMIWLKMVRETVQPKRDNRVDICGYAQLLEDLHTKVFARIQSR